MKPLSIIQFRILILAIILFSFNLVYSQTIKPDLSQYDLYLEKSKSSPTQKEMSLSFVATPPQSDVSFNPILKAARSHNKPKDFSQLLKVKEESMMEKLSLHSSIKGEDITTKREISFNITQSYYADLDNGCPNDNTIAVGNDGKVISMMNGNVGIYNADGSKENVYSLEGFFNFNVNSPCDPKVEYDMVSDRYFMFVQACGQIKDNVAMGFSQTNNPNGAWNLYVFPSDALGDGSWSDYPKIAITSDEVFVSLNLFENGGQGAYRQGVVYQMDKYDGYNGNSLSYKIWDGFTSTTMIVRSGTNQYGPGAYMINGSAFEGNSVILSDITGNLGDPSAQLLQYNIPVASYKAPAAAHQPDTDINLDTGDCRIQDGYYQNGTIHFVHSVSDEGWGAIRYYRLDPTNLAGIDFFLTTAKGEKDYAYPSISPMTNTSSDQTSLIHFAASSGSSFPEMRGKVFQDDFTTSASSQIYQGDGGVHESCFDPNRGVSRWGDYSGIAVKYNSDSPTIYVAGSIAAQGSHNWWTRISRLEAIGVSTSITEISDNDLAMFPIPATDYLSIYINIKKKTHANFSLYNNIGSLISNLYEGVLKNGENRFTFDTSSLANGNYFLNITNENNEIIKSEKIVVAH